MFIEFGTKGRMKPLGETATILCPACGKETPFAVFQAYDHLFLFHIPVKEVDKSYYATCPLCASVYRIRRADAEAMAIGNAGAVTADSLMPPNEEENDAQ